MILIDPNQDWYELPIGEVTFLLSPLTWGQRQAAISGTIKMEGGQKKVDMAELAFRVIKYSLKDLKGVKGANKKPFVLKFEDEEFKAFRGKKIKEPVLSDSCAESLITGLHITPSLETLSYQLLNGIPQEIADSDGKVVKGVKIKVVGKPSLEKRKKK